MCNTESFSVFLGKSGICRTEKIRIYWEMDLYDKNHFFYKVSPHMQMILNIDIISLQETENLREFIFCLMIKARIL